MESGQRFCLLANVLALAALFLAPAGAFAQASPSPYTSATRYDGAGRVTGTISAGGLPLMVNQIGEVWLLATTDRRFTIASL